MVEVPVGSPSYRTLDKVDPNKVDDILAISKDFNFDSFKRIKEIESVTRHDVKAVEYFIDEKLKL